MKITHLPVSTSEFTPSARWHGLALIVICLVLSLASAHATAVFWDGQTNGAASDGSGILHSTQWFNGTTDVPWADGVTNIIGSTTPGNYTITVDAPATILSLAFRSNNYTLAGSTLTYTSFVLSPGANTTINCPLSQSSTSGCTLSNGAVLTMGANFTSTGNNPSFNGTSLAAGCTLNITNGVQTAGGTETYNNITVNHSGGSTSFAIWNIGRTAAANYNLSGGSVANTAINAFSICRGFPATFTVSGTGLLGAKGFVNVAGGSTADAGTFNIQGGTVNIGTGVAGTPGVNSATLAPLNLLNFAGTYTAAAKAIVNISGGVVTTRGVVFSSANSTNINNPACQLNVSGGNLYVDATGITLGSGVTGLNTLKVTLSGGTVAATANWIGSVPMTLTNLNGDVTLQAADVNGSSFNITLAGALSGVGGLIKTGGGNLTLSGTNSYSGTSVVNNGLLAMSANGATSVGPVQMAAGTTLSSLLVAAGKTWTNTGLVMTNLVTADFNFGGFQSSPSSRVIQVNGDLTLDTSDSFTIEGNSLIVGTFPLMTCTGTLTLTGGTNLPTITSLPSGVTANLSQSGKTINLVVTSSPNNPLNWGPSAAGPWDFTTTDWANAGNGAPTNYSDGLAVNLNDNSNNAVVITLNTNVQPVSVTVNNNSSGTVSYTINGTGAIAGGTSVLLQGTGTLAMGASNTYFGGTTVNSGTLAINNGGNNTGSSGIGSGTLTMNSGALDNTSGSNIILNTTIPETWNGDFSYAGSQANLDLGIGPISMGNNITVTVVSNILSCGGTITDNGSAYKLTVQGPGALTLSGFNNYTGGTTLNSGKLNINNGGDGGADSAVGAGTFVINGGTIDNTSGSAVQLQRAIPESWNSSFVFAGSTNLDLGTGTLSVSAITLTLQNGATLVSQGGMSAVGAGAVATFTLAGSGVFQTTGTHNNPGLSFVVGGGVRFEMCKASGSSVHSVGGGLNILTNGLAIVTGTGGRQIINTSVGPVTLNGGTLDLNGSSESIFSATFNAGILQNSMATPVVLTLATNFNLHGTNCIFDVTTNGSLAIAGTMIGTGSLVAVDAGTLSLSGTNTYSGTTTVSNGLVSFITATHASNSYTVAAGELEAILDPAGLQLQMTMSNLTFGAGTRLGFDLASGTFGDTVAPLIAAGPLTMNGNVAVDVTNAPADSNDDVLLSYSSRTGPGDFIAGNVPPGAFIYDNTVNRTLRLTYTQPPPQAPLITSVGPVLTGNVVTGVTFSGVHGPTNGTFHVVSSTNVALHPLSAWTPVQTGSFDGSGNFTTTVSVSPGTNRLFYAVSVP